VRPTTKKLLALSAAVSLGLAACGDDEVAQPAVSGEAAPVEEQTTTTAEADEADDAADDDDGEQASADDPASTLRAQLTAALQEHVYLTGMALGAVVTDGEDDPAAQAAVQALDDNSVAISEVIGEIPGVDDTEEFLELWREHIDLFADYATGTAEGDDAAVAEALAGLEEYQESAADLLEAVTDEELLADDAFAELETHVTMVTDAIDAMVEDDPEALTLLRDAARHMDEVAGALATAVVAANPDEIEGDPESSPARTRAQLTSGMVEHTYLTLFAAQHAADAGSTTDPSVQAAVTLVEGNAETLANAVGGASGTEARGSFLELWRGHVSSLLDRAAAQIDGGDTAAAGEAESELALFRDATVALLDQVAGPGAGTGDIGSDVDTYLSTINAAIDAVVAGEPTAYDDARAAAAHATDMAARLATGIVSASADDDAADRVPDDGADTTTDGAGTGTDAGSVDEGGIGRGDTETGSAGAEPETDVAEPAEDPSENPAPDAEGGR
jgi:hypothetical protein